jgi:hypothetical protein
MPKKKDKKSKSKKGLSTKDILKLLKKLKPKNQQIVRVNVGESSKKKGNVQSSYNPPFVFPTQGYPAIMSLGQPPYKPPLIDEPREIITRNVQPVKNSSELMPPPLRRAISETSLPVNEPTTPRITDVSESEFSEMEIIPRQKKISKKGYSVRQPYTTSFAGISEREFTQPKLFNPSNLSETSSQISHFNLPVQNDKYQPDIIRTDAMGDQIGTLSNPLPSDLWTGTPQGEIEIPAEEQKQIEEQNQEPVSLEDIFVEEQEFPIQEEEEKVSPEEEKSIASNASSEWFQIEVPPKKSKVKSVKTEPLNPVQLKGSLPSVTMLDEINKAIGEGFPTTDIPSEYLSSRGFTKGNVKKGISAAEIVPIYEKMLQYKQEKEKQPKKKK